MRAVDRIGMYNRLMDEEKEFYVRKGIPTRFFKKSNLDYGFDDATEEDADAGSLIYECLDSNTSESLESYGYNYSD
jgi:hypothetical protein